MTNVHIALLQESTCNLIDTPQHLPQPPKPERLIISTANK